MNHGGPAFPSGMSETPRYEKALPYYEGMTLLDWFAGQALQGLLSNQYRKGDVEQYTADAYTWATAMLAEKARREAVAQESSTTDHSGEANKMVEDHFPDATKMTELEAQNRELLERIKRLENAGNDLVWWFCQKEESQLSSMQSVALKQWRDLRVGRNP